MASLSDSNVRVAVRVRPMNRREHELGAKCVIDMNDNQTVIHHPAEESHGKQPKNFTYDHCFWSFVDTDPHYASQESVFQSLGTDVLENAFQGYNACIFAYGQTGSGKSYTMMGTADEMGIMPRLCAHLFERIERCQSNILIFKVEISYMEIYNEKVRDLLDPKGTRHNLRVREHTILGPYVDGLSVLAVSSHEQIESLMEEGNKSRTVAATNMNDASSRSHAVFCIKVTQTLIDEESGVTGEKVSKISLVDLAGSERAQKSGAVGERLREGSKINKSLTTLGLVISALADQSSVSAKNKNKFVPYRDSVLTWLLKDSLGGNSRTVMVATVSPSADNYEESMSTLRYADRAKRIVNHAVVNEDPNAKIIRELRSEVEMLRSMLKEQTQGEDLKDRLAESEKIMCEISRSWEERLKETEQIHQERQQVLEKMGITIKASGIKVEHNKYYLVNLNADPSLNELLVYYLKSHTVVGLPDAPVQPDIQLQGLGIMQQHAIVTIEDVQLYIEPIEGARTCVNGSPIGVRTQLRHADRVLFGNNHFFRVNCPTQSVSNNGSNNNNNNNTVLPVIDYDFAQEELMMKEMSNDPVSAAVSALEKQHQLDKEAALEKQRQMYEQQIQLLKKECFSPMTPSMEFMGKTPGTPSFPLSSVQARYVQWARARDEIFKKSLAKLKEEIVKANTMVREANLMAADMGKQTTFSVTLQIPASNLSPSKIKKGAFISEPAVLVKRKAKGSQLWNLEKLENKLIDMRDLYQEWKERINDEDVQISPGPTITDPFFESQENHSLIGVANVFLEVLFHDVKLDYHVPIISQQGEVAGRLHVEIYRISSHDSDGLDKSTESLSADSDSNNNPNPYHGKMITCRVRIKKATGLPPSLSHFVFCQYNFWSQMESVVVPPTFEPNEAASNTVHKPESLVFQFGHERDFDVYVGDEFLEHVQEDALSIQVWGHRSSGFSNARDRQLWDVDDLQGTQVRSLQDRWAEVTRRLHLWVEIHELNDHGQYAPVTVSKCNDVLTGGIYNLRQGQQRRVVVRVEPLVDYGMLPLVCQEISSVYVGCICNRNRVVQKPLDSYQDLDLDLLRQRWGDALNERRTYLDGQIQRLINKPDKSEVDVEREQALIAQWVSLTEERNAVYVPSPNSNLPGAPADWEPPAGMEGHIPVIYLDLKDDINTTGNFAHLTAAGSQSILPKEHNGRMVNLDILKVDHTETTAVASWDSSVHEHPEMEVTLRKRCCVSVVKAPTFAERWLKKFVSSDHCSGTGVYYDIVAHVPKSSLDPEARETLALVAARGESSEGADGESYIEKYTRGISEVESILALDRLRQEVAIRELLSGGSRRTMMKKATSLPLAEAVKNFPMMPRSESGGPDRLALVLKNDDRSSLERPNLITSLVSPAVPSGRFLSSVKEEQQQVAMKVRDQQASVQIGTAVHSDIAETVLDGVTSESASSLSSSGYGSQVFSAKSEESILDPNCHLFTSSATNNILEAIEDDETENGSDFDRNGPKNDPRKNLSLGVRENILNVSTYSEYGAKLMDVSFLEYSDPTDE